MVVCVCEEYVRLEENKYEPCYDLAYYVYCDHMGSAVQELWRVPCAAPIAVRSKDLIYMLSNYVDINIAKELVRCVNEEIVPRVTIKRYECPYCSK